MEIREFDLKVGDNIIFPDSMREDGAPRAFKGKLNIGKVIGIYPHIFHVLYYVGANKDIPMYRSFSKVTYQIGEVLKEH